MLIFQKVAILDIAEIEEHLNYLKSTFSNRQIIYSKTDVSDKVKLEEAYTNVIKQF